MPTSSMQKLGHIIAFSCSVLMGYLMGRASYLFRKTGGLHGGLPKGEAPLLFEDHALEYAKTGANIAAGYVDGKLDQQHAEDDFKKHHSQP